LVFLIGFLAAEGFIFDREKWAHPVELNAFRIARAPVTNREYAAFVEAGGYRAREFWSAAGWAWRERERCRAPGLLAAEIGRGVDMAALRPHRGATAGRPRCFRQLVRSGGLVPLGQASAAHRGRMGSGGDRRAECERQPSFWCETAVPWGDATPSRHHANLDFAFDGPADGSSGIKAGVISV
jgi:gamma-glutamyl hercynylcysteine S-oxide synthase